MLGEIVYLDQALVKYRRHDTNAWPERGMVEREKFLTFQQLIIFKNWLRDLERMP